MLTTSVMLVQQENAHLVPQKLKHPYCNTVLTHCSRTSTQDFFKTLQLTRMPISEYLGVLEYLKSSTISQREEMIVPTQLKAILF